MGATLARAVLSVACEMPRLRASFRTPWSQVAKSLSLACPVEARPRRTRPAAIAASPLRLAARMWQRGISMKAMANASATASRARPVYVSTGLSPVPAIVLSRADAEPPGAAAARAAQQRLERGDLRGSAEPLREGVEIQGAIAAAMRTARPDHAAGQALQIGQGPRRPFPRGSGLPVIGASHPGTI